jgi:hypothetical protein
MGQVGDRMLLGPGINRIGTPPSATIASPAMRIHRRSAQLDVALLDGERLAGADATQRCLPQTPGDETTTIGVPSTSVFPITYRWHSLRRSARATPFADLARIMLADPFGFACYPAKQKAAPSEVPAPYLLWGLGSNPEAPNNPASAKRPLARSGGGLL